MVNMRLLHGSLGWRSYRVRGRGGEVRGEGAEWLSGWRVKGGEGEGEGEGEGK